MIRGGNFFLNARPEGLEPSTYRSEVCCSIQLSYGRIAEKIVCMINVGHASK